MHDGDTVDSDSDSDSGSLETRNKIQETKKQLEHFLEQKVVVDQQNIFDHCKHFEIFS